MIYQYEMEEKHFCFIISHVLLLSSQLKMRLLPFPVVSGLKEQKRRSKANSIQILR